MIEYNGTLKPHHVAKSGYRYYSQEQLNHFFGLKNNNEQQKRRIIGYCRVSSNKQKDDLERQIENVKTYMIAKGYSFDIISDIGSGINYNKKGLNQLVEDLIQIVTVFSCRMQGKRANKAKKMIKELLEDDNVNES